MDYVQGSNSAMKRLYDNLRKVALSSSSTVLIYGETGTGKEVMAQQIHQLSKRKDGPFIAVNATTLSPELLESELFGHEAGAFTSANKTKKGLLEVAEGGTLLLDEIGEMDLAIQAKILRVLQEHQIRRVGGLDTIPVDVRLIAATNRDLDDAVKAGRFRQDLYYRLNVVPLILPPLRDRPDDIEALANHFIQKLNPELGREIQGVSPEALVVLQNHQWPGNIRELRNVIERAMLMECDGPLIIPDHLKLEHGQQIPGSSGLIGSHVPLELVEREHISAVLRSTGGNKFQAAKILEIDRTTLYNKLKKIDPAL
jgi:transcriptional regulator with PAS, ATPase and Fis domain